MVKGMKSDTRKIPLECMKTDLFYLSRVSIKTRVKGTQMGPLFVLVCPYFRENVIVTRKFVSR